MFNRSSCAVTLDSGSAVCAILIAPASECPMVDERGRGKFCADPLNRAFTVDGLTDTT